MCEHCHYYSGHHPSCPNAPEPPIFDHCEICDEPIYEGDEYYHIDEKNYCEACVRGSYRTAEVDYD